MIFPSMIQAEAITFLKRVLKDAPGALREVTEPTRLDLFVRNAAEKANQIELYSIQRGYPRWNWKDFVHKATAEYARGVLEALDHRATQLYKK